MQAFDASSIVYAWDNYPLGQFPGLWQWLSSEIKAGRFVICEVALKEVEGKFVGLAKWLKAEGIQKVTMTPEAIAVALSIKAELGIDGDAYHGKGVGENDIMIVASACVEGHELISNEERQPNLPENKKKRKIPAVCAMESVAVPCHSFIEVIKSSGQVFSAK